MEFEEKLKRIAGTTEHGWQKIAAQRLGVTARTLRNALNDGPSDKLSEAVDKALARLDHFPDVAVLKGEAGAWAVGRPVERSRDKRLRLDCVVTHMKDPVFVARVSALYGKTVPGPMGEAKITMEVAGLDPRSSRVRDLVEHARKLGLAELERMQWSVIEAAERERMEAAARKTGVTADEAAGMSFRDLVSVADEVSAPDLDRMNDILDEELRLALKEGPSCRDEAYLDGYDEGLRHGDRVGTSRAKVELGRAVLRSGQTLPGIIVVKRAAADARTARGRERREELAAAKTQMNDAYELGRDAWIRVQDAAARMIEGQGLPLDQAMFAGDAALDAEAKAVASSGDEIEVQKIASALASRIKAGDW